MSDTPHAQHGRCRLTPPSFTQHRPNFCTLCNHVVQACLAAQSWDLDAAYEALRRKGLAAAAKKAGRHAADGLVGLATVSCWKSGGS